jgi:hypothetical protein
MPEPVAQDGQRRRKDHGAADAEQHGLAQEVLIQLVRLADRQHHEREDDEEAAERHQDLESE